MSGSALHMLYSSIAATDVMHRSRYERLLFDELRALGLGGDAFDLAHANMQVDLGDGSGPRDVRSPRCDHPACPFKDE